MVRKKLKKKEKSSLWALSKVNFSLSIGGVLFSIVWARVTISKFASIVGYRCLSAHEMGSIYYFWGITVPWFVGSAFILVAAGWMLYAIIKKKLPKTWLLLTSFHLAIFLFFFFEIVGLSFDAFN